MKQIGIWTITKSGPQKAKKSSIDLEEHLEEWIENDPSLLLEGLKIIGRQVPLDAGIVDLIGLDSQGRWVVIEIKRGLVRRKTVTQALDYAACIATMHLDALNEKVSDYLSSRNEDLLSLLEERGAEELNDNEYRDVQIYVVGLGKDPGLERLIGYLAESFSVPIVVVLFEVFGDESGQQFLIRELSEVETKPIARRPGKSLEDICLLADNLGFGSDFRAIIEVAQRHSLFPRPYRRSVMLTPPENRTRMLFTIGASRSQRSLKIVASPEAFSEFYTISEEQAKNYLEEYTDWKWLDSKGVNKFIDALNALFEIIEERDQPGEDNS